MFDDTPQYITEARGNNRLPGIMTLGYIAAFSETLALAVVVSKGRIFGFWEHVVLVWQTNFEVVPALLKFWCGLGGLEMGDRRVVTVMPC